MRSIAFNLLWSAVALVFIFQHASANCAYGTMDFPREPQVPVSTFGYDYLIGPLNWFGLNQTANGLCNTGKTQSPIILNSSIPTVPGSSISVSIVDYPSGAEFENLGTNVEVVVNGSLTDGSKTFKLAQFHFHSPSEHRIEREFYPMEGHFVFQASGKTSIHRKRREARF
jgi:carbonic anhydrase